jgi:hypothetical protein
MLWWRRKAIRRSHENCDAYFCATGSFACAAHLCEEYSRASQTRRSILFLVVFSQQVGSNIAQLKSYAFAMLIQIL